MVVGFDIEGTEKPINPAVAQISIEEDDVPVNYIIQLRSELPSSLPTDVFDESFPVRFRSLPN